MTKNKIPTIKIDGKTYKHITQFKESANTISQKIWQHEKRKLFDIKYIKLPAGKWIEIN